MVQVSFKADVRTAQAIKDAKPDTVVGFVGGHVTAMPEESLRYASVIDYPLNIGGRPPLSWPSFIPVTFEMTILVAAFVAVLGMLGLNGLPMPYHPVFNVERFVNATRSRFFLCIEATDPLFDRMATGKFLESLEPREVCEVPQ